MRIRKQLGSLVLVGLLAFGVCTQGVMATDTETEIQKEEEEKARLEEEKQKAEAQRADLTSRLETTFEEVALANAELVEKEQEIATTEDEMVVAKIKENEQYEAMKKRIQFMYENGNTEVLFMLFETNDISEFLTKAEYIKELSEYDRTQLVSFQDTVKEIEEKEAQLAEEYVTLTELQEALEVKQAELEALIEANSANLSTITSTLGEKMKVIEALKQKAAEAKRLQEEKEAAERRARENAQRQQQAPVISGNGQFSHPAPGTRQSSYFGEVRYGIGDTRPHQGNDYAGPFGTPIYAAAAGTVVIAGWSNSAGNWIVIDHGGGLVTKYMHCSQLFVSEKSVIAKGEHIAAMGSTGQSTGSHLHFQVEVNGVPVHPDTYL